MTSRSVVRRAGMASPPKARVVRQGVVGEALDGYFHVTHLRNLDSIQKRGLLVKPPERTYGKEAGVVETIGGIYLAPAGYKLETVLDMVCSDGKRAQKVGVLAVRVEAGTRFCLAEDEVNAFLGMRDDELEALDAEVFGSSGVIFEAVADCGHRNFYCSRRKLDRWSCALAKVIDQSKLLRFNIRVFSPPTITAITVEPCLR